MFAVAPTTSLVARDERGTLQSANLQQNGGRNHTEVGCLTCCFNVYTAVQQQQQSRLLANARHVDRLDYLYSFSPVYGVIRLLRLLLLFFLHVGRKSTND